MGMKAKRTVHCPYCSKQVAVNPKGLLVPHVRHGKLKCPGVGMRGDQMSKVSAANAEQAKGRRA